MCDTTEIRVPRSRSSWSHPSRNPTRDAGKRPRFHPLRPEVHRFAQVEIRPEVCGAALSAGIELVLKERLRREDEKLIFVASENATLKQIKSGLFKTVTLWESLKRLEEHCPVSLPDKKVLEAFKGLRNSIEHFEINHSRDALEALAAVVLAELLDS
jgi:hypothetical protein